MSRLDDQLKMAITAQQLFDLTIAWSAVKATACNINVSEVTMAKEAYYHIQQRGDEKISSLNTRMDHMERALEGLGQPIPDNKSRDSWTHSLTTRSTDLSRMA